MMRALDPKIRRLVEAARTHPALPKPIQADAEDSGRIVEAFRGTHDRAGQKLVLSTHQFEGVLDVSWLEHAAATYNVSPDPKSYVLTEVPGVTIDFPNRNSQAFPLEEVTYYDPLLKQLVYRTFVGAMTALNHDNKDPLKARGVIFDAALRYVPQYDTWKIVALCGFDRDKDRWLAEQIATRKRTKFSLGGLVQNFVCSYCGKIETDTQKCECMQRYGKGAVRDGSVIYQVCTGVNFIEMSSVEDPADVTAEGRVF